VGLTGGYASFDNIVSIECGIDVSEVQMMAMFVVRVNDIGGVVFFFRKIVINH
jgi:hypothetical protein